MILAQYIQQPCPCSPVAGDRYGSALLSELVIELGDAAHLDTHVSRWPLLGDCWIRFGSAQLDLCLQHTLLLVVNVTNMKMRMTM